ncbi:hypothetical protein MYU51_004891 [Penicillium brevicompactum]
MPRSLLIGDSFFVCHSFFQGNCLIVYRGGGSLVQQYSQAFDSSQLKHCFLCNYLYPRRRCFDSHCQHPVQSGVISTPVGAASTPLAHTIVPSAPSSVPFVSPQSSVSSPQGTTVGSQGGASASIPVAGTSAVLSASSTIGQGSSQSTALSPNGATTKLGSTGPQDSSFAAVVTSTPTLSGAAQSTASSGFSTLDLTTSTVLSTRTATITACPTTVPNCPATAKTTFVTTETIVVSTTICPVIEAADATKTPPNPASITGSSENGKGNNGSDLTTSTVYSTRTATITACPSSVTNCPLRSKTTYLTTETLVVSTTICPVSEATATGASATAKQTSPVVTGMSGNGADSELTTSTVYATHTATVLACPESVADCPLRSKTLSATTQTVAVATTVYSVDFVHTTVPGGSGAGAGSGFNSGYNSGIDSNSGSSSSSSSAGNANAVSNAGSGAEAVHTTTIAVESCSDDNTCTGYINTILMTQTSTAQSTAAPTPFKPHWSTSVGSNTVSVPSSQSSGMTTTTISATTGAVSPVYTGAASAQIKQSFKLVLGTAMAVFVAVLV